MKRKNDKATTDHPNSELSETFEYSAALVSFKSQGLASIDNLPNSSNAIVMVNYVDEQVDLNSYK